MGGVLTCAQLTAGAVLRAMLRHRLVAMIQFCNYYLVAFPIGFYLAVYGKAGVFGVYNGLMVGMTLSSVTLIGTISFINFDQVAQDTLTRLQKDSGKKSPRKTAIAQRLAAARRSRQSHEQRW